MNAASQREPSVPVCSESRLTPWLRTLCLWCLCGAAWLSALPGLTATPAPTPTPTAFQAQPETVTPPATRLPRPSPTPPWVSQPAPACLRCPPVPVFHSNATGEWTLMRLPLAAEGTEPRPLTTRLGRALAPAYAPNGRWLAFQANWDGNWELYTTDLTSGHLVRQTYHPARDTHPVWRPACLSETVSATGTLAFQSDRNGQWDLFLLNLGTGEEPRPLTTSPGQETLPVWAPDGSRLAFQSDRAGQWDIFTIRPDGSDEHLWTTGPADEITPAWSPLGRLLVYATNRAGQWDLYLLDLLSGQERPLTNGPGDDLLPAWSPDGHWLAFQSNRDGNWELYAYELATGTLQRLTTNPAADEAPAWSCDGRRVLFQSNRDGDADLYAVALYDPTDFVPLTFWPSAEIAPLWQPAWERSSQALEYLPPVAPLPASTPTFTPTPFPSAVMLSASPTPVSPAVAPWPTLTPALPPTPNANPVPWLPCWSAALVIIGWLGLSFGVRIRH